MPNPLFSVVILFAIILALKPDPEATEITGGSAADRQRLAELSAGWLAAYREGDLHGIMAIMHEDAVVMPHDQPTYEGLGEIRDDFGTRIGRPGAEFVDDLEEISINGDWAYVRGRFSANSRIGDDQTPRVHHRRYLVLYEKVGRDWKMLRNMDNVAPAPLR